MFSKFLYGLITGSLKNVDEQINSMKIEVQEMRIKDPESEELKKFELEIKRLENQRKNILD